MENKIKNNSNNKNHKIKILSYPVYPPLKINLKNTFEQKPRKNSVMVLAKFAKNLSRFRNIAQEKVVKILSKDKKSRIDLENRMVADYLSKNYNYFYQIKQSSKEKFLKLISVLNLENTSPDEIIINIGEENINFYVVLEGTVNVYRKYKYKKDMTFYEFCEYLKNAKNQNLEEFKTALEDNSYLDLNFEKIINDELVFLSIKNKKFNFTVEESEDIGTFSEGYSFGELSLMNKKNKDMIIKSITKCKLISVSKFDYNRILKTIEEKRLEKKASIFKKNYPIFKFWAIEQLINLFNYFSQELLNLEEFLYKQNDENEYIYFIDEGSIEQYTNVSFSWYLQFNEYIENFDGNLLGLLKNVKNNNPGELHSNLNDLINNKKKENNNKKSYEKFPFLKIKEIYKPRKIDLIKISELYDENQIINQNEDNFLKIKYDENNLNNPEKIYRIPISSYHEPCIIGLEEAFDLKKKFTTVKCISGHLKAKKIKIIDFLKVLYYYKEFNYIENFHEYIIQKKSLLSEIIKTHMTNIGYKFEKSMNDRYEKIITQSNSSSYKIIKNRILSNKKKDQIIIATKLKGWDNGSYLDNVLDTSLHLLIPKSERQIKLEKNKKCQTIKNLFKTKNTPNEKIFSSTKFFFSKIMPKIPISLSTKKKLRIFPKRIKDINNKKENILEKFFKTSISPKKNIYESRNKIKQFEEKKNEDNFYMKTFDNYLMKKNKIKFFNSSNNLMNKPENKRIKKSLKKIINYKVTEDYFKNNEEEDNNDNNNNDIIKIKKNDSIFSLNKIKENDNIPSIISTIDKEK